MGTATMSSAQLSKEFAVALTLIKKLDERDPGWEKKLPAKKAAEPFNFAGQETTMQIHYKPYEGGPKAFRTSMVHRKRRDEETEYWETVFKRKQLFGKKGD